MNFHLQFPLSPFPNKINYRHKLLLIGSCFAENIGARMNHHKLNALINPHGILYNPSSVAAALRRYAGNVQMKEEELFQANEVWNSWEHHSSFSHPDKKICLEGINDSIAEAHACLKEAKWLFITFGSAFVYSLKEKGMPVGNCHKLPQKEFTKELLKPADIVSEYTTIISALKKMNPGLNIVLTVSPVRYIRDGVVENNLSKSVLIQSVHELLKENSGLFYFPAYELVLDDLRDYRFYKEDLVHPNELAITYVFDKLKTVSFEEETTEIFERIQEIRAAMDHRPFNDSSLSHKKFCSVYVQRCEQLKEQYPFIGLGEALDYFKKALE